MASINAKGHHHEWQSKPPDGKLEWSKTWDERYWDEEELAANFMYSSPEEISRLKNLLKQDPGFENSSSWPWSPWRRRRRWSRRRRTWRL